MDLRAGRQRADRHAVRPGSGGRHQRRHHPAAAGRPGRRPDPGQHHQGQLVLPARGTHAAPPGPAEAARLGHRGAGAGAPLRGHRHRLREPACRGPARVHHVHHQLGRRAALPRQDTLGRRVRQDRQRRLRRGQPGPGLRRPRPRRRPGADHGLQLPLGGVPARTGGADRLGARGAALRQDPDSGQQDHPRDPALRIRLVRWPGERGDLAARLPARHPLPRPPVLRHRRPGAVVQLHRGRPPARRLVREPGQLAGEVRGGGRRGQAGSSCGCSVTRTPGPGARCTPRCPCRAGHDDSLVGAGGGDPRRQLPVCGGRRACAGWPGPCSGGIMPAAAPAALRARSAPAALRPAAPRPRPVPG